jgi:hypothetical protein
MIELSVIRDLVAIFGVIAGFTYYVMTVQNARKNQQQQLDTRQAQLFMEIYKEFSSPDFLTRFFDVRNNRAEDYEKYVEKFGDLQETDIERYAGWISLGTWFEGLGTLLQFGLIDPNMVYEMMGGVVFRYWNARRVVIEEVQKIDPHYGEYIMYLQSEMEKIAKVKHPDRDIYSL